MVLVGAAHHGTLVDSGVLADDVFDHRGEDLEAVVADDEAFDAAVEVDETVLVHVAHVAGVGPHRAVFVGAQDVRSLFGLAVVALHHGGAADAQFAPFTDGQFFGGARLEHRHKGVHHGDAHAAGLGDGAGGDGGSGGDLRHAVTLGKGVLHVVGSKEVVHRLFCADGDGIAAGGIVADEGQILVFQLGVSGHLLVMGRHTEHVFGLVLQQKAAELGGVQIRDDDDLQPQGQRHVDAAGVAIGDEGGHDV